MDDKIGENLVRLGIMEPWQVDDVLLAQRNGDDRLFGEIAIVRGYIDEEALKRYLDARVGDTAGRPGGRKPDVPAEPDVCVPTEGREMESGVCVPTEGRGVRAAGRPAVHPPARRRSDCEYQGSCHFYSIQAMTPNSLMLKQMYCVEWPERCAIHEARRKGRAVTITLWPTGQLKV